MLLFIAENLCRPRAAIKQMIGVSKVPFDTVINRFYFIIVNLLRSTKTILKTAWSCDHAVRHMNNQLTFSLNFCASFSVLIRSI